MTTPPADWYPDPTERHQYRYWDGREWTAHVATDGVAATDPLATATSDDATATDASSTDATSTDATSTDGPTGDGPDGTASDHAGPGASHDDRDGTADEDGPDRAAAADADGVDGDAGGPVPTDPEDAPAADDVVAGEPDEDPAPVSTSDLLEAAAGELVEDPPAPDGPRDPGGWVDDLATPEPGPEPDEPVEDVAPDPVVSPARTAATTPGTLASLGGFVAGRVDPVPTPAPTPPDGSAPDDAAADDAPADDGPPTDEGAATPTGGPSAADVADDPADGPASPVDGTTEPDADDELAAVAAMADLADTLDDGAEDPRDDAGARPDEPADAGDPAGADPVEPVVAPPWVAAAPPASGGAAGLADAPPPTGEPSLPGIGGISGDLVEGSYAEVDTDAPAVLQNPRMLRCRLTSGSVLARQGAMVAQQGEFDYAYEGAGGIGKAFKRAATGEGVRMMRVTGTGDVFLADGARHVFLLELDGGAGLKVSGRNVLAFADSLQWDVERVQGASLLSGSLFTTTLRGRGWLALVSDGQPVVLRTDGAPTSADVNALVAWSADLHTEVMTSMKAGALVGFGSGEAVQLAFRGSGVVVVQPSEGYVPQA